MIIDMHVHTSEGSIDGKVSIHEVVDILKGKGYDGVLVTDHNSYGGYNEWVRSGRDDFKVLRGIEYDTSDAGHIIVILPENINSVLFTVKGLNIKTLQFIVHKLGGVLGPAHPYEYHKLGIGQHRISDEIYRDFDFIEGFNSCSSEDSNRMAVGLADKYGKQVVAGSDSHNRDNVGSARTEIDYKITGTNSLIEAIKLGKVVGISGEYRYSILTHYKNTIGLSANVYYYINKVLDRLKLRRLDVEMELNKISLIEK